MVQELVKHGALALVYKELTIHLKPDPNLSFWLPQAHTSGPLSCHSISQETKDTKPQNTQPLS